MRPLLLPILLLLLAGCASKPPMEAPPAQADLEQTNPYEKYYKQVFAPATRTNAPPRIYAGNDREADRQRLLEEGYDMMGYSAFEAGDVPPELLSQHAAKVGADLVLVNTRQNGMLTMNVQRPPQVPAVEQQQGAAGNGEKPAPGRLVRPRSPQYEYVASYWTRLPTPVLGLHVQNPAKDAPEGGLPVIAVIRNSPAASAEIRSGDRLKRIGDTELGNVDMLKQATRRYAGEEVEIVFARAEQLLKRKVRLNRAGG